MSRPAARKCGRVQAASSGGRSVSSAPSKPACARPPRPPGPCRGAGRVQVREEHQRQVGVCSRIRRAIAKTPSSVVPGLQRPRRRALEHRAVGDRIGERHAELEHVRARPGQGFRQADRRVRRGVAGRQVGDERRAALAPRPVEGLRDARHVAAPSRGAQVLVEVLVAAAREIDEDPRRTRGHFRASLHAKAIACADSRAGRIPSSSQSEREGVERLGVGHLRVRHPAAVVEVRVLGPDRRIVEPGRDRVRRQHLPVRRPAGASSAFRGERPRLRPRSAPRARPVPRRVRRPRRRRARRGSRGRRRRVRSRSSRRRRTPRRRADRGRRACGTGAAPRGRSRTGTRAPSSDTDAGPSAEPRT